MRTKKEDKKEEPVKASKDPYEEIGITPLKDKEIHFNDYHIFLKEGVSAPVPRLFLQNLVTEKVIKNLPK